MRPDPFLDPFDRLTYENIYEAFRDIGSETQRLEFKQQIDPEELARQAVAMANGSGGLIIVGFEDPRENLSLVPHEFSGQIDEPARRRLLSKIQSRVYPSIPVDCAGFTAKDGRRLLALRVESSDVAPHECINDRGRFVVRRGTEISGMTLRELEVLMSRPRSAGYDIERARSQHHGMLAFDVSAPESFVGATLFPETRVYDEPLSRSQQHEIEGIVRRIDHLNGTYPETYPEGILFSVSADAPEGAEIKDKFSLLRWSRRAYISSSGRAEIRRPIFGSDYQGPIVSTLCDIYALGSQLLLQLGLGPRASGSVVYHGGWSGLGGDRDTRSGTFKYDVNFAADTVEQMARRPLMFAMRVAQRF